MLSVFAREQAKTLLTELERSSVLFDGLARLTSRDQVFGEILGRIATGGQNLQPAANELHNFFIESWHLIKGFGSMNFYNAIRNVGIALEIYAQQEPKSRGHIFQIQQNLNSFGELFEVFQETHSGVSSVPMLTQASRLNLELSQLRSFLKSITEELEPSNPYQVDTAVFNIYFSEKMTLAEVSEKIAALSNIIDISTKLLSVQNESPISIKKIESGSLWIELIGNPEILSLATAIIGGGFAYIFRNYTREGKLKHGINDSVNNLVPLVDLAAKLKELGVDSPELNEELKQAALDLTKYTRILVRNQTQIHINGTSYQAGRNEPYLELPQPSRLFQIAHNENNSPSSSD